jgi:hypothetical protein
LRLVSAVRATPNRYYRQGVASGKELEDGFPRTAAELDSYDAIVIGSLEAAALATEQHEWLRDFVDRRGGSLMLLGGRDGMGTAAGDACPSGRCCRQRCRVARRPVTAHAPARRA